MVDSSFRVEGIGRPPVVVTARARNIIAGRARRIEWLHVLLFALFLAGAAALSLRGYDFYHRSVLERVDHPDLRALSPTGSLGHGYGVSGTALIVTNLLYLVRRRFARLSVGSLRVWLDVHVFTGLFGAMLVLFHSAFQARSGIAQVTMGALLVVIVTGLLGRYLFALSPQPELERLHQALRDLDAIQPGHGPGLGQVLARRVALVARTEIPAPSLLAVVVTLPRWRRELVQRRAVIAQTIAHYEQYFGPEVSLLAKPIAEATRIYSSEVRAAAAQALLRSWRGLHRFSALLMLLLVALHIGVAWYYGFAWHASE